MNTLERCGKFNLVGVMGAVVQLGSLFPPDGRRTVDWDSGPVDGVAIFNSRLFQCQVTSRYS